MSLCPITLTLFFSSATAYTIRLRKQRQQLQQQKKSTASLPECQVVFVLGGPGSGKGTQCQLIQERIEGGKWSHLSAGDLLRAERKKEGSPTADLINTKIAMGAIVPAAITVSLLRNAMEAEYENRGCTKFLIDGFPRSEGNITAWNSTMAKHHIEFVLNFVCPEEILIGRLLERGQTSGRNDDQIDVIRKRFHTFQKECKPIVEMYEKDNKVRTIASDQPIEDVYNEVATLFRDL
mmetsp:Transcript_11360/g.12698  ORF Transcript_11360/g.12698 Transcript_11360/m.12698 type:complete len:236 (+) Transcript_11360:159-866(+)|eukprot:CAMPEP_0194134462 /NCGR_PEP_ID=MMETSP0152-20130528/4543_1 /TAXON_ID=1049557 /ORGANISM="Thalassiothrix antarctica, Strain L6-D1" /LENGTH=235 /DNA_ID=CAMNT_0038830211 /DNA_START=119 /DNA_END=826 /DNA_ORIENTATION=+